MKKAFSFLIALFLVAVFLLDAPAQTKRQYNRRHTSHSRRYKKNYVQTARNIQTDRSTAAAVAVLPSPSPSPELLAGKGSAYGSVDIPKPVNEEINGDVQSGNVVVNVNSNGNAVVKIGLADRAVSVVDFPANDPVYKIHPGDENFVTVGCSERDENGRCGNSPTDAIVLRPGKNFHSLDTEESAATVVTIQRVSGIVVTLIVVPVKTISQNANYVVVRYNLKDVLEARMKAGLAVNLQPGMSLPGNKSIQPADSAPASSKGEPEYLQAKSEAGGNAENGGGNSSPDDLETQVVAELTQAAESSNNLKFSKPVYGLSLARALSSSRTGDVVIEVIAVRNTLPQPIRLVPEQPKLVIENKQKRNESINIQSLAWLHMATTAESDDVLAPGQIYYYAFAYPSPILDVKQVLRVSFAQREAADVPASLELGDSTRK